MRTIKQRLAMILFALLISLVSFSQEFKRIPASEVDMERVKIAESFAFRFMNAAKDSSCYEFKNDEATDALKNVLSKEAQMSLHSKLKGQFGEFQNIEYAGAWQQCNNSIMLLARFKADFSESNKKMEIRVVLDENDKIDGFRIFPWSDVLGE